MTREIIEAEVIHRALPGIEAGVHHLDVEAYHADPAPEPSLSASGIHRLLESTPAHFRAHHPRLSPWPIEESATERQDLGTAVHTLVLGEGKAIQPLDVPDFKTKAARALRDAARAAGAVPMKRELYDKALTVAAEITKGLTELFGAWPIGHSERTILWQRETPHGLIWCRGLTDHVAVDDDAGLIVDLKTTSLPTDEDELSKKFAYEGGDIQAAFYTEGVETLFPNLAGRVRFMFIVAEVDPPYSVRPVPMPESWLCMTRRRIDRAAETFARCLKSDFWPGWQREARLSCPVWLEKKWMDAELAEEE